MRTKVTDLYWECFGIVDYSVHNDTSIDEKFETMDSVEDLLYYLMDELVSDVELFNEINSIVGLLNKEIEFDDMMKEIHKKLWSLRSIGGYDLM